VKNRIRQLAGLFSKGGAGFQGVRDEFGNIMKGPGFNRAVDDLTDEGARSTLQTAIFGRNVGANRLMSQAMSNRFNRAFAPGMGAYDKYTLANLGKPTLKPREWIQQSEWADLLDGL
jgi:hypothetical protein